MTQAARMTEREVKDAVSPADDEDQYDNLRLGKPFAIAHDCGLVEKGCTATLECDCGQAFRFDLMQPGFKGCPSCKTLFTHVLLVCQVENDELFAEMMDVVFTANGIELPETEENPDDGSHRAEPVDAEELDGDAGDDEGEDD